MDPIPLANPPSPAEVPTAVGTKAQSPFLLIFLTFLITSALFVGGYFGYQYITKTPSSIPTVVATPTPTPTPQPEDPTANWNTYTNSIYQFKYPSDIQLKESDGNRVTLTKAGPTQKIDTEFYDGISLNFDPRELPMTPQQYAQNIIANSKQNFDSKIIKEPVSTKINQYVGVDFILENLGETHYYVIQSDDNILLTIADSTVDPNSQGYAQIVTTILSTFKFTDNIPENQEKQIGYLKAINNSHGIYSLTIDYIQMLSDEKLEATQACIAAGDCVDCPPNTPCVPNGYYIENSNPKLRTFPIAPNVVVLMQTLSHTADGNYYSNQPINLSELVNLLSPSSSQPHLRDVPYWITLVDGQVIRIEEQYLP